MWLTLRGRNYPCHYYSSTIIANFILNLKGAVAPIVATTIGDNVVGNRFQQRVAPNYAAIDARTSVAPITALYVLAHVSGYAEVTSSDEYAVKNVTEYSNEHACEYNAEYPR